MSLEIKHTILYSWLFRLAACAAMVLGLPGMGRAAAQAPIDFSSFEVDLWPEYDRPDMLVIYKATMATAITMPVEVSLRIPASVGRPFNVAYQEMDGQLYNAPYDTQIEDDWLRVTFSTPSPTFQLEYYDPGLERDADERSYQFRWPGDYSVQNMILQVQQPVNAEAVSFTPDMGQPVTGANGLLYYSKEVGEVPRGTAFQLQLSYTKRDDVLTSSGLQPVEPSAPIQTGSEGGGLLNALPIIFAAAGLLLLGTGLVWMFMRRNPAPVPGRQRRRGQARRVVEEEDAAGEAIYCHSCGKRAAPGDTFCRTCGTRLRVGGAK